MQTAMEAMLARRSCRAYTDEPVDRAMLDEILKAGTYAASGKGQQPAIILAVTNRAVRDELSRLNAEILGRPRTDPFYGAPVVLVVLADRSYPNYLYDGTLVMGNLMLAAHAEGLGSCWIHRAREAFDRPEGKALLQRLGITGDYEGIGHCVLGHRAAPDKAPAPRKADYIHYVE